MMYCLDDLSSRYLGSRCEGLSNNPGAGMYDSDCTWPCVDCLLVIVAVQKGQHSVCMCVCVHAMLCDMYVR